MNDGLSRLLPDDPQNLLSIEARKRIQRAHIESEKYIWKAEVLIEQLNLEGRTGHKAALLRKEACFNKAKAVLLVFRREFSQLDITEGNYREIMREEIEGASHSLQLSGIQQRLLENEFFFPEEKAALPPIVPPIILPKRETVASQIEALRRECQLTADDLAGQTEIDIRSVRRHLRGDSIPFDRNLWTYQRVFSKLLNKQVIIRKMSEDVRKRP
jgi:hypothetical protein